MKTIMILGAGAGQTPFISICRKRGYRTIVVSPEGDYPGFALADKVYYFDTRDKEKILDAARKENIDAVTTDQTDVAVPTVAYVAEKLGLKGLGVEKADIFTHKYKMRRAAAAVGIPVPEFGRAKCLSDAIALGTKIGFPVIMKPVDNSGSRGIHKINNQHELIKNFEEALGFSSHSEVIIEKFLNGSGYLAEGYAMDGEYHTLAVGEKQNFKGSDIFASSQCVYQSPTCDLPQILRSVENTNNQLMRALNLSFGITHADYLYNYDDGKIYLVECAARGGGIFISSHIMPLVSGFNTNEALLDFLVEEKKKKVLPDKITKNMAAWLCFGLEEGTITQISGLTEISKLHGVKNIFLDQISPGTQIKTLKDNTTKLGPIIISSDSINDINNTISSIKKILKIQTSNSSGIHDIIW